MLTSGRIYARAELGSILELGDDPGCSEHVIMVFFELVHMPTAQSYVEKTTHDLAPPLLLDLSTPAPLLPFDRELHSARAAVDTPTLRLSRPHLDVEALLLATGPAALAVDRANALTGC